MYLWTIFKQNLIWSSFVLSNKMSKNYGILNYKPGQTQIINLLEKKLRVVLDALVNLLNVQALMQCGQNYRLVHMVAIKSLCQFLKRCYMIQQTMALINRLFWTQLRALLDGVKSVFPESLVNSLTHSIGCLQLSPMFYGCHFCYLRLLVLIQRRSKSILWVMFLNFFFWVRCSSWRRIGLDLTKTIFEKLWVNSRPEANSLICVPIYFRCAFKISASGFVYGGKNVHR